MDFKQKRKIERKVEDLKSLMEQQRKILMESDPGCYGYENIKGRYEATILDLKNAMNSLKFFE